MTGTTITELRHSGGFVVSEARGELSRDQVTLLQQAAQSTPPTNETQAGTVLGAVAVGTSASSAAYGTAASASPPNSNVGNGTMGSVTLSQGVAEGVYQLVMLNTSEFEVYAPNGDFVGSGRVGQAFAAGGLAFTLTGGSTGFVAGDGFQITLAANANVGDYNPVSLTAADGTQNAAAILWNTVDATGGNTKVTVISRQAEVNGSELIYPSGASASQIAALNAQLLTLGIVVR